MRFECPDGIKRIVISACERCPDAFLDYRTDRCPVCSGEFVHYTQDSGIGGGTSKKGEWILLTEIMFREAERSRKRAESLERLNSARLPGASPTKNQQASGSTASAVKPTSNSTGETSAAPTVSPAS